MVVDAVVGHARAHALWVDRRHVAARPARLMMQVAVVDKVMAGRKAFAIAARQVDAAVAVVPDVAALHAVVGPVPNPDAVVARVGNAAAGHQAVLPALYLNGVAARGRQLEIAQDDMARALAGNQRLLQQREHDVGPLQRLGRPQVEHAGGAVHVVLARRVELFEYIEKKDAVAGAVAVQAVGRTRFDVPLL